LLTVNNFSAGEVGIYFYNPNIHPQSEYLARLAALKKVIAGKPYRLILPHRKKIG
jgi:predicted adenine nucleotide alpha hydrolase (AANH) superfamily ATPase